jgi:tRNA pseudouridine32 synthase/23S rRNA pseudouridine746 synthase
MNEAVIFNFRGDISVLETPMALNNPFGHYVPEIAVLAAQELQQFIEKNNHNWGYDFSLEKGKMFGVLVVQQKDGSYGYLGTVSGSTSGNATCSQFAPSIFDNSVDDFFMNRGMTQLTEMSASIKASNSSKEIALLKVARKEKSLALQQQLFENYTFLNQQGKEKGVLEIFEAAKVGKPPSAAGDCAAPKLLQYAFKHRLKPIAIAEFWWGKPNESTARVHKHFYPACKNKCRPILEFMLSDKNLFDKANAS